MLFEMNYTNLLQTAAEYLERSDLSDALPKFIRIAEKKVARVLKAQLSTITVTSNLTAGSPLVTKPERWIETLSFSVQANSEVIVLKKRSRETIQAMFPNTSITDVPKYYAEWQENYFYVGATPADDYPFELLIYQEPQPLSDTNQTNFLTDTAPDLLLYSTLLEAESYLKNDERIAVWKAAQDEIIMQITGLDMRRQTDRQQKREKGA